MRPDLNRVSWKHASAIFDQNSLSNTSVIYNKKLVLTHAYEVKLCKNSNENHALCRKCDLNKLKLSIIYYAQHIERLCAWWKDGNFLFHVWLWVVMVSGELMRSPCFCPFFGRDFIRIGKAKRGWRANKKKVEDVQNENRSSCGLDWNSSIEIVKEQNIWIRCWYSNIYCKCIILLIISELVICVLLTTNEILNT